MSTQAKPNRSIARRRKGQPRNVARRQRGVALILVLLLSVISLGVGMYSAYGARTEMSLSKNDLLAKQALNVAQAGLNHAAKLISNHAGLNDELAANSGGACTANGVGNGSSGLSLLGAAKALNGGCYRFRAFGPGATDGYYLVVADNHDEAPAADNQLVDKDNRIVITSIGVVASATRTLRAILTAGTGMGFFGINKVTMSGSSFTDSFSPPYVAGSASAFSNVGSNKDIELSGSATINGSAAANGQVKTSGSASVTGSSTNGAALQTFPAVPSCTPHSNNIGIAPSSAYKSSSGDVTMGGGGSVTLAPGTYCFDDFVLSGGSTLIITGPVTLNLTGKFDSSGGTVSNTTQDANNLIVNSDGGDIKVSSLASQTYMTVYAPKSKFEVNGGGDFFGSVVALEITASSSTGLHQQLGSGGAVGLIATHEIR